MELETPDADSGRTAQVSWAEIQLPNAPRKAVVSWAEIELPDAPRKAVVSWAEFEIPNQGQLDQVAFRFYAKGAPATSTAQAAENINYTENDHVVVQLRIGMEETNGGNVASQIFELWAKKNAGAYERLSDHTMVRAWRDTAWTDDVATTDRLTTPAGTFGAGRADQVDCITSAVQVLANGNTEMVYSLIIKRDAGVTNDTWTFEIRYAGGGALEAYTRRPVLTLNRIAEQRGFIKCLQNQTLQANRTIGATMPSDTSLNFTGTDDANFEARIHAKFNPWTPATGDGERFGVGMWDFGGGDRSWHTGFTDNGSWVDDPMHRISETGATTDVINANSENLTNGAEIALRWEFIGDFDATNHRMRTWWRTGSAPEDLEDAVSWGTAQVTTATPLINSINPSTSGVGLFVWSPPTAAQAGMYVDDEAHRVAVWEGTVAGRKIIDWKPYDAAYRTPEAKLAATSDDWVNQGDAPGVIGMLGTESTDWDWVAETTNRTAQVSWAELELPNAPRKAVVSWAELEIPDVPRSAIVSWAELEIPNAPRKAVVSWAELELPSAPRTAQLSWAELELPDAPRKAIVSWAELEIPNAARKAVVSWAELEIPTAPRSAIISWAELEIPTAPRTALVSWAELEIPETTRKAQVSWAELEIPSAPRKAIVSWAELELPDAPRTAQLSWAELELPDGARTAIVSWAELELPNAPRTAIVSWAELEIPTAPRQAIVSWAELEIPSANRSAIVSWAELEVPNAPRKATVSWAELEIPNAAGGGRSAQVSWVLLEIPGNEFEARATVLTYTPLRWTIFQETSETKQEHMKIFPPSLDSETGIVASEWVDLWLQDSVTVHIWGMVAGDVVVLEGSNAQFPSSANLVQIQPGDITEDNIYKIVKTPRWLRVNKTANAGAGSVSAIVLTHA
jgi:hypothetical protein